MNLHLKPLGPEHESYFDFNNIRVRSFVLIGAPNILELSMHYSGWGFGHRRRRGTGRASVAF
jgi:hypothetical protein